jgi:hypothetical protein
MTNYQDIISIEMDDEDGGEETTADETVETDTTDYKALYEQEREAKEQTEAEKQKRKERFK